MLPAAVQRLSAVLPTSAQSKSSEIQRERLALLEMFEASHNLPVADYAKLTGRSRRAVSYDIQAGKLLSLHLGTRGQRVQIKRSNVLKNTGRKDWGEFMAQVIAWRLSYDPLRYKDYGPYWWAIKPILRQYDYAVGEQEDNVTIRQVYCGEHDEATLLMADLFREDYLKSQFIGTHRFMLDNEGEFWELFDEEMEMGERALALSVVKAP